MDELNIVFCVIKCRSHSWLTVGSSRLCEDC